MVEVRSEEAYFGTDNPLVTQLTNQINLMRIKCESLKKSNPNIKNSDIVKSLSNDTNKLGKIISDEMNIENCFIGYTSINNLYSLGVIWNKNLYKNYKKLKSNLDDIAETKNGYKFKNKKGIYFCIILSIKILLDNIYTDREIVAFILHEIGHCMVNIINGLDSYVLDSYTRRLLDGCLSIGNKDLEREILKEIDDARNDPEKEKEMAESLISRSDDEDETLISFDKLNNNKLTEIVAKETKTDLDAPKRIRYKRSKIGKFFGLLFKNFFALIIGPFMIPKIMKSSKSTEEITKKSLSIKEEEIADNMAISYGLGVELSKALKKANFTDQFDRSKVITRIPFLDLYSSYKALESDHDDAMSGYPSNEQRVTNAYVTCKYELDNNKDLTPVQKKEIEEQIIFLKSIYDDYVFDKKQKGLVYRLFSKTCKSNIEKAAMSDSTIKSKVLDPLKKRSDTLYK